MSLSRVIVNEQLKDSQFLSSVGLEGVAYTFSKSIKPHLIFGCYPTSLSVTIVFVNDEESMKQSMAKLEGIQRGFRHSYGIVVCGSKCDELWECINLKMQCGMMRIQRAHDKRATSAIVKRIYEAMSTSDSIERMKKQAEYFSQMKDSLVAPTEAKGIYETTLDRLQVSERDQQIIMDALPTIQHIATADLDSLLTGSPAESESLEAISNFFAGK